VLGIDPRELHFGTTAPEPNRPDWAGIGRARASSENENGWAKWPPTGGQLDHLGHLGSTKLGSGNGLECIGPKWSQLGELGANWANWAGPTSRKRENNAARPSAPNTPQSPPNWPRRLFKGADRGYRALSTKLR
jgi:hypothetical protein